MRVAPIPTIISTNSEPLMLKNTTPASPATAFASSVLPVHLAGCYSMVGEAMIKIQRAPVEGIQER